MCRLHGLANPEATEGKNLKKGAKEKGQSHLT
jgi:hypothetical protein